MKVYGVCKISSKIRSSIPQLLAIKKNFILYMKQEKTVAFLRRGKKLKTFYFCQYKEE